MRIFILTITGLMILTVVGKIIHLAKESGDRTTPRALDALDVVIGAGFITWAIVLL